MVKDYGGEVLMIKSSENCVKGTLQDDLNGKAEPIMRDLMVMIQTLMQQ